MEERKESTGDSQTDSHENISGLQLAAVLGSVTLVSFLMLLDTSIVATAIPRITSDFHSLDDVGWYGTAYLLANCSLQPLTGKLYTYFSNKWTYLAFFTVFEIGSALCGAAQSSNMLIIGRAVAGMGASGLFNGAFTIMHASVPAPRQPALLGIMLAFCQLGTVSGPLVGGALTQHASWRWCFYINLPCAAVAIPLLIFINIPDNAHTTSNKDSLSQLLHRLDLPGFALFAGASIQLLIALNWGGTTYAWSSSTIIGLFCGSGVTVMVFIAWEHHQGLQAMVPLSLISRRVIWASCLNYGLFTGCILLSIYFLPIYFQAIRNATPTMSGVDILPTILSNIVFSVLTGAAIGRVGYYLPFGVASAAFNLISTALLTTLTPTSSTGVWIGFQILQGVGRGLGFQVPIMAVQNNTPKELVSIATALVTFFMNMGAAVSLSLGETIFSTELARYLAQDAPSVDAAAVVAAGASAFREVVPADLLPEVLRAYCKAITRVLVMGAAVGGGQFLVSFGTGWVSVKKEKKGDEESEETQNVEREGR
ncbi:hypothetical protein ASPZODRAFT_104998 [Penicilliopsis zonata CBS 506.65]|uniref:Major facilitator superfamily (MFS) profile domain-containing protein n=1 Tax=Penicilliopsis zonata CBS 506.65 TaxID=1073090 RepID=A0A1L9S613_9EURO|nr:hypothetical protein ASPZODRAFT_104998 [Penicilliopsis zonata CBS 506.65]OJJ42585.1 hypothetical protein ASPZODRAFT_104998 [Penicilliopsis zonata CBS 506.65]